MTRGNAEAVAYAATPRSTLSTPMSLPRCFDVADFVRTAGLSVWMAALLGPLLVPPPEGEIGTAGHDIHVLRRAEVSCQ